MGSNAVETAKYVVVLGFYYIFFFLYTAQDQS